MLVAFQSLLTIKKGTSHCNFQSNEPFSKFLRQLVRYEVPWSKTKNKKKKIHCANIVLYLGSSIALPMMRGPKLPKYKSYLRFIKKKEYKSSLKKKEKNRIKYIFDFNLVLLIKMLLFVTSFHFKFK